MAADPSTQEWWARTAPCQLPFEPGSVSARTGRSSTRPGTSTDSAVLGVRQAPALPGDDDVLAHRGLGLERGRPRSIASSTRRVLDRACAGTSRRSGAPVKRWLSRARWNRIFVMFSASRLPDSVHDRASGSRRRPGCRRPRRRSSRACARRRPAACSSSSSLRRTATSADIEPSSALRTVGELVEHAERGVVLDAARTAPPGRGCSTRSEGCAWVPRPCTTVTRPFSSMRFTDSRITVRLTPKCALSSPSGGSDSPGATSPVTIALTRSWTTATPSRAAGMRASAGARNERLPGRGADSLIWSV